MTPLAHHTGEETLAPLLLLASGGLSLIAAIGRERLAAARAWLARKQALTADAEMQARERRDAPGRHRGSVVP